MSFFNIFTGMGTASTLIFLAAVGFLGIFLGKLKIGPLKLGIAGVLFVGLFIGHLGAKIDGHVLHFVKEFGLILFVYSIGIEIGPRFITSLKSNGLKLNMFAAMIVVLGLLCAIAVKYMFNLNIDVVAGLFSGAVTNTPSLGAVQSLITEQLADGTLSEVINGSAVSPENSGMAYAVAYPFGILGIILAMSLIRMIFKIVVKQEAEDYKNTETDSSGKIETIRIIVQNKDIFGKKLSEISHTLHKDFVVSRIFRDGEYFVPESHTPLQENDELIALCRQTDMDEVEKLVGAVSLQKKMPISEKLSMRHIRLTNRKLSGKTIREVNLKAMFPANITRIFRGQTEIIPKGDTVLQFGDTLRVVGHREKMDNIALFLGNSLKDLSHPNLIPLFIGTFLGILLGSIPIFIPGLPAPAKLGLAGGPLIVALILGHKGRIGKMDFFMTPSANLFIRELGIVLFLACVGLGAGAHFVETIMNGGYMWMLYAAIITFVPLMIVGILARIMKVNYLTICGFLAGSMTDPPALEFANNIHEGQAQATAYATVYPLTMFLRILLAQLLVLLFA